MYHDEKVIDGILHFRGLPCGPWTPYTAAQLAGRGVEKEQLRSRFDDKISAAGDRDRLLGEVREKLAELMRMTDSGGKSGMDVNIDDRDRGAIDDDR